MRLTPWLSLFSKSASRQHSNRLNQKRRVRPAADLLERLEDRALLSVANVTAVGDDGWYADDVRNTAGTDLVGSTLTQAGKPGQAATAADDIAIAQQLSIVAGPAGSTYGGAIRIDGTANNAGKSNFSTINTGAGFGAGSILTTTFDATYQWFGQPNLTSRTVGFKIGVQSSQWAASQTGFTAIRSGESAWDLVLVYVPATSDNVWTTEHVNASTGTWSLFRQAGNGFFVEAIPAAQTLASWNADPTWGPRLFGAGSKITSVQFGLGSFQSNSISYVDYLQTNILNGGDVIDFGGGPQFVGETSDFTVTLDTGAPGLSAGDIVTWNPTGTQHSAGAVTNLTFGGNAFTSIQAAINAASAGDTVNVTDGLYSENINVNKKITLAGGGSGTTANDTRIDGSVGGAASSAITVSGSGASAVDRLTIKDLHVQGNMAAGFDLVGPASYVTLLNVTGDASLATVGASGVRMQTAGAITDLVLDHVRFSGYQYGGVYVEAAATVNGFTLKDSELSHNRIGLHTYATSAVTNNQTRFTNVTIQDTLLLDNSWKGLYFEKLDHAVIQRLTIQDTGIGPAGPGGNNGNGNSGVELNLKHGAFSSIQILNNVFDHTGIKAGVGGTDVSGALAIKPRNDAPSYSANPATLDNVLVSGNIFTDLNDPNPPFTAVGRAILIGETGKNTVTPTNMTITNNSLTDGSFPGLVNTTAGTVNASINYWGSATEAGVTARFTGPVDYSPWFTMSTDTSGAFGFQGDYNNLGVSSNSPGPNSLQEAIDAAAPGSTLNVAAGTYSGVVVNKNITIIGAGAGVTFINGASPALTVNAGTTSLSGFTFTNAIDTQPVILVTATGSLNLGTSTVNGSFLNQTLVQANTTGSLNLGTAGLIGNNTFNISGGANTTGDAYFDNITATSFSAVGNRFDTNNGAGTTYIDFTDDTVLASLTTAERAEARTIVNGIRDVIDVAGRGYTSILGDTVVVPVESATAAFGSANAIGRSIGAATAGNNILVGPGVFSENVAVSKAVTLLGNNAGTAGTGVRVAESTIRASGATAQVVAITSSGVTVNGFTIDGDDTGLVGGALFSGDDSNAARGVFANGAFGNLTVTDNIVVKVGVGVHAQGTAQGSVISDNWFDSIGNFDFGYAVSLRNSYYADVTGNRMTRSWTGVHLNNHSGAGGPASWTVSNNEIHSYAGGILDWLNFNGATSATISNNQITAEAAAVANNFGILVVSLQDAVGATFTSNTITGHDYGFGVFNAPTSSTVTLGNTNSVVNAEIAGVFVTNNLNFNPVGTTNFLAGGPGAATQVNIAGMPISLAAGATGVLIDASFGANAQRVNFSGATTITGGATGLRLNGALASAVGNTIGTTAFVGQTGNYITLSNGSSDNLEINATAATFDGLTGAGATLAQNYAIENKITHATDDATLGFVRVQAGNVYVTNASASIQRGIDAAVNGDTINIQPGVYAGSVSAAAKGVTLAIDNGNPGQVTINGNLTLTSDDFFPAQLAGLAPANQFDNFVVNGTVDLGGATLVPSISFTANPYDRMLIVNNDGADAVTGTFNGLAEGAIVLIGGQNFRISYIDNVLGDGNDVSLTRLTPGVSVTYSNGSLIIVGTSFVDDIELVVTGTNSVTLVGNDVTNFTGNGANGQLAGPYNVTGVISISLLGNDDRLLLRGAGGAALLDSGNVTIDLGAGNDTLTTTDVTPVITPTTGFVMTGDLSVIGGAGNDTVSLGGALAADTFSANAISIDTGAGVAQSISIDRTTVGTNMTLKNGGTGAQSVAVGFNGPNTVGRDLIIAQADGATGYSVLVRNTGVGRNLQIANGNGTGLATVTVDTNAAPARTVGGSTFISNGNNASNAIGLVGTTGGLKLTGNVTAKNGNATTTNSITVTDLNDSGTSAASFTNGNSGANTIAFNGTISNTFLGVVAATNGTATGGTNLILASHLSAKGLTFGNGVSTAQNTIILGGATAVVVNGNTSLTNSASADILVNIDRLTTTVPSGNVTVANATSGAGGTDVIIGAVAAANSIAGNLTITNQSSTGARLVTINNATVNGAGGLSLNNAGAGNSTVNIGTATLVTVAKKLDIQDGTGAAVVNLNTVTTGSLTYNDLGGGVDTLNLAQAGGTFRVNGVTRLNTGLGGDVVSIAGAGTAIFNDSVFIDLGSGNDSLTIGAGASSPAFTANRFQFNGNAGDDTITVNPLSIADYTVGNVPKKLKSKITNFEHIL